MDKEHSSLTIQVRAASTALLEDTKDEPKKHLEKLEGLAIARKTIFQSISRKE